MAARYILTMTYAKATLTLTEALSRFVTLYPRRPEHWKGSPE
jgi:hypothetical protein